MPFFPKIPFFRRRRRTTTTTTTAQQQQQRTNMFARLGDSFTQAIQASLVTFVVSVGEVEASDTESRLGELLQLGDFPTCRSNGKQSKASKARKR
jgi:hypothetical protein